MADYINFAPKKLKLLKIAYDEAVLMGRESFIFENKEILVDYAKYMIEYLEGKLKEE
jgi:hypothetical protein